MGVATNLLPNTGLPLPFISYGLSALLANMVGIGLVINIDLQKDVYKRQVPGCLSAYSGTVGSGRPHSQKSV